MKPQAGELCNDPACGTFGFMIADAQYVRDHTDDFFDLSPTEQIFQTAKAFTGCELVHDTHRLALMNAMLHGLDGRAAVVLPDNVLFADGDGERIRVDLMDKCDLHTVLRLSTGIFYAQSVKTNVLFFTRGTTDIDNTRKVWFYDLRTNMLSFGKTNPLRQEHFADFERAFEADDRRAVVDERFNLFTREQITDKKNFLDLGLIRDDSLVDFDELPDPIALGEDVADELQEAVDLLQGVVNKLRALEGRR